MKKIIALFSLLFLFSCEQPDKRPALSVLVTLPPYAYFVEKIAQQSVHIEVLVPPGTNPHIYEPNPKQVKDLLGVSIWFQVGETIEHKLLRVLQKHNPAMVSVDLSEGISLLKEPGHDHGHDHEGHEGQDRHIWLSPKLAEIQARTIANALIATYPEHKEKFEAGLTDLLDELQALDQEIAQTLEPLRGKSLLVSHPAFGYFCQEFGLQQLSIECEGKDPLPKHIESMLKEAIKCGVKEVLTQVQYNNKAAILIGDKLHIPTYEVDPYAPNYISNLRHITQLIAHEEK